jgi:YbbR domain-containing protein
LTNRRRYVQIIILTVGLVCAAGGLLFFRSIQMALPLSVEFVDIPQDLVVAGKVPPLEVRIEGPKGVLRDLKGTPLTYQVSLHALAPGKTFFEIRPERIHVPEKVSVIAVDPGSFVVRLAREQEKVLPVVPDLVGEPAPGYIVIAAKVVPTTVRLAGAATVLDKMSAVKTTPVDLTGSKESIERNVALSLKEAAGIQVMDPGLFEVHIEIEENIVERRLKLKVRGIGTDHRFEVKPEHIEVTLRGPENVFDGAVEEGVIDVRVDLTGLAPGTYFRHVVIEPPLNMTVLETMPETFRVDVFE